MHIVSEVVGELAEGKDAYDVIAATFPGGTITGAPKIRTMEIIEELEPVAVVLTQDLWGGLTIMAIWNLILLYERSGG